jgi:hypothetical protein
MVGKKRGFSAKTELKLYSLSLLFSFHGLFYRFFALKYAADAACTVLRVDQVINWYFCQILFCLSRMEVLPFA